jgi:protein-L-isoaspartate(D-aspartate) O-methyltransferase
MTGSPGSRRQAKWPPDWPDIQDPRVLRALRAVPRHRFVPPHLWDEAYEDGPLPIGYGQTISQPYIVALMTQALALNSSSRVLEIGTGSGYQSAILAHITAHVWSVETVHELAVQARQRLRALGYHVHIREGDGRLGWPENAPYSGIIVAAAGREPPPALLQQLVDGGRLVLPVGDDVRDQALWLIQKHEGRFFPSKLADVRFVPLVGGEDNGATLDVEQEQIRLELRRLMSR